MIDLSANENAIQNYEAFKEKVRVNREIEYAKYVLKYPKFHFTFWKRKDDIRHYNELLDKLDEENRKAISYPRITDKLIKIFAICISLYNSAPNPNMTIYGLLSFFSLIFLIYSSFGELYHMCKGNRSPLKVQEYYTYFEGRLSIRIKNKAEIMNYEKLKVRVQNFDNRRCLLNMFILVLDALFNAVLLATTIIILCIRKKNRVHCCYHDATFYMFVCRLSISFSGIYFVACIRNFLFLRNFKSKLLEKW